MKIGIFDSGLGGLIIARSIRKMMPEYDYVYLGDTKRVPYGNRSHEAVFEFTKQGVEYLFKKENCAIVIIACNTASARALRRIQQEYLVQNFPERKVLGVLVPTAEECAKYKRVGIIGTAGTITSNNFVHEISKLNNQAKNDLVLFNGSHSNLNVVHETNIAYAEKSTNNFLPKTIIFQNPAPMLVPLAEEGEKIRAVPFLEEYLKPFASKKIEALALGCTHYPFFKKEIRKILNRNNPIRTRGGSKRPPASNGIKIISQDEIVPKKLKDYFNRHPEISKQFSKGKTTKILLTDLTKNIEKLSKKWFGPDAKPELIKL